MKPNAALEPFRRLIGTWSTTGKHPFFPGEEFKGETSFEWMEGESFIVMRSRLDDPRFPAGVAIIGSDDALNTMSMLYYDERGVSRIQGVSMDGRVMRWWRDDPKFSQRFVRTIAEDGQSMEGRGEMSRNGEPWEPDLSLVYSRRS